MSYSFLATSNGHDIHVFNLIHSLSRSDIGWRLAAVLRIRPVAV